jgi:C-3',4' desaturase CrtD
MSKRVIVIGAGVGGLTLAALLAQAGYTVEVLESQTYAGGSASTFTHKGYRFESGATVAGGFQKNGPHAVVGERLGIHWPVKLHDPAWVVHLPDRSIGLTLDHHDVLAAFPQSERFWQQQSAVAAIAWHMSAQGLPWPPRDLAELLQLAKVGLMNFPRDLLIAPFAFMSVRQWLGWHGLAKDAAFKRFLDASLLISAQTTTDHVYALYGATALDLSRQGVYHVEGGIGGIAETLVKTLTALGGQIHYRRFVTRIAVEGGRATGVYYKTSRRVTAETFLPADFVVLNNTPWALEQLLAEAAPESLKREVQRRNATQGAFVLHLGVRADALPANLPDHHQMIETIDGPMGEGRTAFVSMSPTWDASRAPEGYRAVTISTHTRVQDWWDVFAQDKTAYYERKEAYAERMIALVDRHIAGFKRSVALTLPGSPLTYEFYTLRPQGMVGGFPQRSLFTARGPRTGIPNLRLVGDSIFPGQSTAGVSLGALRVAADVQRHLPLTAPRHYSIPAQGASS